MKYLIIIILFISCSKQSDLTPTEVKPKSRISLTIRANANAEWNIQGIYNHFKHHLMDYSIDWQKQKVVITDDSLTIRECWMKKGELSDTLSVCVTKGIDTVFYKVDTTDIRFKLIFI